MVQPPTRGQAFRRALRLRCPQCGTGRLFRNGFRMHDACGHCGRVFAPEPGFYLGSIYINYGATVIATGLLYAGLVLGVGVPQPTALAAALAVTIVFPIWFFRYARSLLVALDSSVNRQQRRSDVAPAPGDDPAAAEGARLAALAADDASAGCLMGVVLALVILFGLAMATITLFFAGAFSPAGGRPEDAIDLGLQRRGVLPVLGIASLSRHGTITARFSRLRHADDEDLVGHGGA